VRIGLVVDALFLLHLETAGDTDDDRDAVAASLKALAADLQASGHTASAARLACSAAVLGASGCATAEDGARLAIEYASTGGHINELAVARVLLANTIAAAAGTTPARRAEVFVAAESALDAIAAAAADQRAPLRWASSTDCAATAFTRRCALWPAACRCRRRWRGLARPRATARPRGVGRRHPLAVRHGPVVCNRRCARDGAAESAATPRDSGLDPLDHRPPRIPARDPGTSLVPARADFDHNLLVLTHELTHVLSFLAASARRWPACAARCWPPSWRYAHAIAVGAAGPGAAPAIAYLAARGFGRLPAAGSAALPLVQHTWSCIKRRTACSSSGRRGWKVGGVRRNGRRPLHDAEVLDPVNDALRNLVDAGMLLRHRSAAGAPMRAVIDEFQQRSAAALQRHGATRLLQSLRQRQPRTGSATSQCALCWRAGARPLGGASAARRRFGCSCTPRATTATMRFRRSTWTRGLCQRGRARDAGWVAPLAGLGAAEIELLIDSHATDASAQTMRWTEGHPALIERSAVDSSARTAAGLGNAWRRRCRAAQRWQQRSRAGPRARPLARYANQTILLAAFWRSATPMRCSPAD